MSPFSISSGWLKHYIYLSISFALFTGFYCDSKAFFIFFNLCTFPVVKKLRVKFVTKRNQRKRQREETSKGSDKKSLAKRLKTDKATLEVKSAKTETQDAANCEDGKSSVKEEVTSVDGVENVKPEYAYGAQNVKQEDANGVENAKPGDEMDDDGEDPEEEDPEEEDPEEEDPEEPEENEEMLDAVPQSDLPNKARPASSFFIFRRNIFIYACVLCLSMLSTLLNRKSYS